MIIPPEHLRVTKRTSLIQPPNSIRNVKLFRKTIHFPRARVKFIGYYSSCTSTYSLWSLLLQINKSQKIGPNTLYKPKNRVPGPTIFYIYSRNLTPRPIYFPKKWLQLETNYIPSTTRIALYKYIQYIHKYSQGPHLLTP